jgi:nucleotide-binding universal stress UspA family protein
VAFGNVGPPRRGASVDSGKEYADFGGPTHVRVTLQEGGRAMSNTDIVVGLDQSESGIAALRWAAAQARLTGVRLRIVHAWQLQAPEVFVAAMELREAKAQDARARATQWIRDALGDSPGVPPWTLEVLEANPGLALVERSRHASLLVIGTREHTGLRRLVAGSVSHYALSHATCPVVAVPPQRVEVEMASAGAGSTSATH